MCIHINIIKTTKVFYHEHRQIKMIKTKTKIKMIKIKMVALTFLPPQQSIVAGSGRPTGL